MGRTLPVFNAQEFFMQVAEGKATAEEIPKVQVPEVEKPHAKHASKKAAQKNGKANAKAASAAD